MVLPHYISDHHNCFSAVALQVSSRLSEHRASSLLVWAGCGCGSGFGQGMFFGRAAPDAVAKSDVKSHPGQS